MSDFTEVPRLVAFTNFTRFTEHAARAEDLDVARVMSAFYDLAGATIRRAGGEVVKFIGDATLAVFPPEAADRGIAALLDLKEQADRLMAEHGWECRLIVKAHYGTVVAGPFGSGADRRFDVLGKTVNITARLESGGVALSAEAFRQLSPETRKLFKKHTPPITYIRLQDAHHPRWAKRS